MLIIGFGTTETLISTHFYACETCGSQGAHELVRQARRFSLFFIPLLTVGRRYYDTCMVCGRTLEVSREQAESAARQVGPDLR